VEAPAGFLRRFPVEAIRDIFDFASATMPYGR